MLRIFVNSASVDSLLSVYGGGGGHCSLSPCTHYGSKCKFWVECSGKCIGVGGLLKVLTPQIGFMNSDKLSNFMELWFPHLQSEESD